VSKVNCRSDHGWVLSPGMTEWPSERPEGDAAAAIADAEAALAQQNSASSQLDLQVISAILNAHLKALDGRDALDRLQRETEAAVRTRSDLDTPAGARDFQRFLIGKLRDIREVVANVSLDDTSKSALMAAWTSLYTASKGGETGAAAVVASPGSGEEAATLPDAGEDPYLDPLLFDDPGVPAGEAPAQSVIPPATAVPSIPSIPSFGGGEMPGGAGSGWSAPSGFPFTGLDRGRESELDPADLDDARDDSGDRDSKDDEAKDVSSEKPEAPPTGPTTVTLPNGETVTAANPQLAAAIKAAAGGVPIAEAFQQQGITIPAPGTAVANPISPSRLTPGDIGIFSDHHAPALGHDKALLEGQIQRTSTVSGPSFLGWVHPPTPATLPGPAKAAPPAPTRPAAT
jgi:Domain of unknown function (DUF4226)